MKAVLRLIGWIVSLGVLLIATAVTYSTVKGRLTWFFRVNGSVLVNGQKTKGYLHANTTKTVLLVTRTDSGSPETYLVPLQGSAWIIDCGHWHPIRFLPVPIGDVNPPCSGYDTPTGDWPMSPARIPSRRSVEFSTASGKKIKAEW